MRRAPRSLAWLVVGLLVFSPDAAGAGPITWIGPSGGSFQTGANWNPAGPPATGDSVILTGAGGATVGIVFPSDATTAALTVQDTKYQLLLGGFKYTTTTLTVGDSHVGSLDVSGGTLATATGAIGNASGSGGSSVTVDGSASQLSSTGPLFVGLQATGQLSITNGGKVSDNNGIIANSAGSNNSSATIDGTGSQWTNASGFVIGANSAGTNAAASLTIQNGGVVTDTFSVNAAIAGGFASSGSSVVVDGAGSQWTNVGGLLVGLNSTGQLSITGGGKVTDTAGTIASAAGGANSSATVSGSALGVASQWVNSSSLTIGNGAAGTLSVQSGALVSDTSATIASGANSTGSSVTVDGTGSQWTNSAGLTIGNAASGSLGITAGGKVTNTTGVIASAAGSNGSSVTVDGTGSQWVNSSTLTVGGSLGGGGVGSLIIKNSGVVSDTQATIASGANSTNSSVTVSTSGQWTNSSGLTVGGNAIGTLAIQSGGVVSDTFAGAALIANSVGASGSSAAVDGANSKWSNTGALTVGSVGSGQLTVSGGGVVTDTNGVIANAAGGTNSSVTVTGLGSQWTNSLGLVVGNGALGTMNVTAGGVVSDTTGGIQHGSSVLVDGVGSEWTNSSTLSVGGATVGVLTITNGGKVTDTTGQILTGAGGGNSSVRVDGSGSQWVNSSTLTVGGSSGGATIASLTIQNGGLVADTSATIVNGASASGSSVTVDGAGTQWNNTISVTVGSSGLGTLNVTGGAHVSDNSGGIASLAGSSGSSALVSGSGSTWTNTGSLTVGGVAAGSLVIQNGGVASGGSVTIGSSAGAAGSSISVSGAGSQLNAPTGNFFVGAAGKGTMTITNGGVVTGTAAFRQDIGDSASAAGSSATVDGAGSQWVNNVLQVRSGSLTVQNGGTVTSSNMGSSVGAAGVVGRMAADVGSAATITGAGSEWSLTGSLVVGFGGFGPGGQPSISSVTNGPAEAVGGSGTLTIASGGKVVSSEGAIGFNTGSNGAVIVTGTGSEWKANASGTSPGTPTGGANPCIATAGVSGNIYVGQGGLCNQNGAGTGELQVSFGGTVTANTVFVGAGGKLDGNGGIINANVVNDGGVVSPGLSPGTMTINGNFENKSGSQLKLEIGGAGLMDLFIVNGDAVFDPGSTVLFSFLNGFLPTTGETFNLLSVTGTTNLSQFLSDPNNFLLQGLPSGFQFSSNFANGTFSLNTDVAPDSSVPEPGTWLLLGSGLAALLASRRKAA